MPRIADLIARNFTCTRGEARRLLAEGAVIDVATGLALTDPRASVAPEALPVTVEIEGNSLPLHDQVYLMLNKPLGCVTALADNRHPVAYELIDQAPLHAELRPVGRLDLDTTGLLLWSNDGGFIQRLTHPKRAVPRTYQAALARPFQPPPDDFVLDDGHRPSLAALGPLAPGDRHPALIAIPEATAFATITLTGGAYHEVRRIFAALGSHVLSLCRVSYGALVLPTDLPLGDFRLITPTQVLA